MAVIVKYLCDECSSEDDVRHFTTYFEVSSVEQGPKRIAYPGFDVPQYERDLCKSCMDRRIAEYSNFIEGLNKPRS
jgi:hypothetical protein